MKFSEKMNSILFQQKNNPSFLSPSSLFNSFENEFSLNCSISSELFRDRGIFLSNSSFHYQIIPSFIPKLKNGRVKIESFLAKFFQLLVFRCSNVFYTKHKTQPLAKCPHLSHRKKTIRIRFCTITSSSSLNCARCWLVKVQA